MTNDDFYIKGVTLGRLVKLSNEFLRAAELVLHDHGVSREDIRSSLSKADQGKLNDLALEIADIDLQARAAMSRGHNDPATIGAITAKLNSASLQMYDLLLLGAQNILGRDYLTFIAPDELRAPNAKELLEQNKAQTLLSLTRLTLQ